MDIWAETFKQRNNQSGDLVSITYSVCLKNSKAASRVGVLEMRRFTGERSGLISGARKTWKRYCIL